MSLPDHIFHTKHDFTPEFAWAAFQLLRELDGDAITSVELYDIAKATGSPLAKRSDLSKLLAALSDVGLIKRYHDAISLSESGRILGKGIGHYKQGFFTAVHCIYTWKWFWDGQTYLGTPSWSYRECCRQILNSGITGISYDELVLRVVNAAVQNFKINKVSFSRSSVTGVTNWLEVQEPSLIHKDNQRLSIQDSYVSMPEAIRLHLAALCALNDNAIEINSLNMRKLAESFLFNTEEISNAVLEFAETSDEFMLLEGLTNRIIFKNSDEPFINWIIRTTRNKNHIS